MAMHSTESKERGIGKKEKAKKKKRTEVGAAAAFEEDTDGREDDREDLPGRVVSISVLVCLFFVVRSFAPHGVHGGRVNSSAVSCRALRAVGDGVVRAILDRVGNTRFLLSTTPPIASRLGSCSTSPTDDLHRRVPPILSYNHDRRGLPKKGHIPGDSRS